MKKRSQKSTKSIIDQWAFKNLKEENMETINIRDGYGEVFPQELESKFEYNELTREKNGSNYIMKHHSLGPCYLETKVVHNGYVPGDGGHGGKVEIEFTSDYIDHKYDDMSFNIKLHDRYVKTSHGPQVMHDRFSIELSGEWERLQFIDSLKNIIEELENYDKHYE